MPVLTLSDVDPVNVSDAEVFTDSFPCPRSTLSLLAWLPGSLAVLGVKVWLAGAVPGG